jgi:hypothetical protein
MTQVLEYPVSDAARMTGNRRGLLVGFGVTAIVVGAVAVLAAVGGWISLWRLLSLGMGFTGRMIAQSVAAGLFLLVAAVALVWGGVAMIRCRRWVGPFGWAVAVGWLVLGCLSIEVTAVDVLTSHWEVGLEMGLGVTLTATALALLPLAFVVMLSRPGVRRTLEAYHPYPVWTDRHPLPVLAVGTWCGLCGLVLLAGAAETVAPFFGFFVGGWRGSSVQAGWAAMLLAAAVSCFRRPSLGWWLALAALTLYVASMTATNWLGDPRRLFEQHGYNLPASAVDGLVAEWRVTRVNETVLCIIGWLGCMAYLFRHRRDFGPVTPAVRDAVVAVAATATPVPVATPKTGEHR